MALPITGFNYYTKTFFSIKFIANTLHGLTLWHYLPFPYFLFYLFYMSINRMLPWSAKNPNPQISFLETGCSYGAQKILIHKYLFLETGCSYGAQKILIHKYLFLETGCSYGAQKILIHKYLFL